MRELFVLQAVKPARDARTRLESLKLPARTDETKPLRMFRFASLDDVVPAPHEPLHRALFAD